MAALKKLSAEEYLEQTGVGPLLRNLLSEVLAYRPADPLEFVYQHSVDIRERTPTIVRTFRLIRRARVDEEMLMSHLSDVYAALTRRHGLQALPASAMGEVVLILFDDLPEAQLRIVLDRLDECFEPGAQLSLRRFCSVVCSMLHVEDVLGASAAVFEAAAGQAADGAAIGDLAACFPPGRDAGPRAAGGAVAATREEVRDALRRVCGGGADEPRATLGDFQGALLRVCVGRAFGGAAAPSVRAEGEGRS